MSALPRPLVLVPCDAAWPDEFRFVAAPLRTVMGSLATRIDHIGSTAVPELAAKDIIDIQITVVALEPRGPIVDSVGKIGYLLREEITGDHLPPGTGAAQQEWRKLYFSPPAGQRPTHLHVRAQGTPNQRYPILFRDYLRAHPAASEAYAEIKRQLARHNPDDWDAYYEIKDPVCDVIMAAAESWAAATVWNLGPSDA
jgi:GrpB-like predicted nucleotidyltransferase (UPF0157 family)